MHTGLWAADPQWLARVVSEYRSGRIVPLAEAVRDSRGYLLYNTRDGVARVEIVGATMKGDSKFGGTSSVRVRQALRTAWGDPDVRGIMVHVDSPGGTVAGTAELADDIASSPKPVAMHIDDSGTSAVMWYGSGATRITANRMAQVGSIGGLGVIEDTSVQSEALGIRVVTIKTGKWKDAGVDGAPITEEQVAYWQGLLDASVSEFYAALQQGRGLTDEQLADVADARVMTAAEGVKTGLIDAVMPYDQALAEFAASLELAGGVTKSAKVERSTYHERRHAALTAGFDRHTD